MRIICSYVLFRNFMPVYEYELYDHQEEVFCLFKSDGMILWNAECARATYKSYISLNEISLAGVHMHFWSRKSSFVGRPGGSVDDPQADSLLIKTATNVKSPLKKE